tara:strand:- start:511 stop:720 length:210 start_codon:yes stop_codon:yes gene_type:complete
MKKQTKNFILWLVLGYYWATEVSDTCSKSIINITKLNPNLLGAVVSTIVLLIYLAAFIVIAMNVLKYKK